MTSCLDQVYCQCVILYITFCSSWWRTAMSVLISNKMTKRTAGIVSPKRISRRCSLAFWLHFGKRLVSFMSLFSRLAHLLTSACLFACLKKAIISIIIISICICSCMCDTGELRECLWSKTRDYEDDAVVSHGTAVTECLQQHNGLSLGNKWLTSAFITS